ncbi:alpha/beta hydrolase family protein [Fulvivirga imtechensis]|uniref:alpha/beta hydrolase family protein n=1 Tax=Fulvivirga imtechensis TaxID=881893 RepID=UPI0012F77C44|nr:dienelactone hydrolase family protein [Fulvivirga imtechensis]
MKLFDNITLTSSHHSKKILTDIRYIPDHRKKPVILFIHGFKGFKDWGHFNLIADTAAEECFIFVKPNLSHNGTTPENPQDFADLEAFSENNFSIELDDTGTVINYLFSQDCVVPPSEMDLNKLFLMGHSRGGGLVLLKAKEDRRIKGVATWSAVDDFNRWTDNLLKGWKENEIAYVYNSRTKQNMPVKYQIVEDLKSNHERLHISNAVKVLQIPFLIVHGSQDETVGVQSASYLHKLNPQSELLIIDGANHVLGGAHPYYQSILPDHTQTALKQTLNFFKHI